MRNRTLTFLTLAFLIVTAGAGLTACSDDNGGDSATTTTSSTPESTDTPTDDTATTDTTSAPADAIAWPAVGSCAPVPVTPDGRYTIAEVGAVVVTESGGSLTLGEVTTNEGWQYVVEGQSPTEIEIEFSQNSATNELDFDVEIDDGRVEVEICHDTD